MKKATGPAGLEKCPTGIRGLDDITLGGLPRGRPTLVCGGPGCGKTLLGMEFLVRGATEFNEPGVCLSFEETAEELAANAASLGFDINALVAQNKLAIDHVFLERSLIEEAGEYDLEALFVRLGHAVDSTGAQRVLLDSVEALFAGLENQAVLRSELRRLFRWLKHRQLTAIVTAERGENSLTRYSLEEYISDCVILLDYRLADMVLTRRIRVVKYRGSGHGTNEYPFLIEQDGISVLPVTSLELKHSITEERVSTGIPALDAMLGGEGYYRGSGILISGAAGSGKTSLLAHFIHAACRRGEHSVFFSFEESPDQIVRNMRSIGVDLGRWMEKGLLHIQAARPSTFGLEMHLVNIHRMVEEVRPAVVAVDTVSALQHSGTRPEAASMLLRLIDFLKGKQITALLTALTKSDATLYDSQANVSSLVDVWLLLREIESYGERNRVIDILKARGLAHSSQIREFLLTDRGIQLRDMYLGDGGLLTGSARVAQESKDEADAMRARHEIERRHALLERRKRALEGRMAALRLELQAEEREFQQLVAQEEVKSKKRQQARTDMAQSRSASAPESDQNP